MSDLTDAQLRALIAVKDFKKTYGMMPTRIELSTELGFNSPNSATEVLKALEKKGYIEMIPDISRGIKLTRKGRNKKALPFRVY